MARTRRHQPDIRESNQNGFQGRKMDTTSRIKKFGWRNFIEELGDVTCTCDGDGFAHRPECISQSFGYKMHRLDMAGLLFSSPVREARR